MVRKTKLAYFAGFFDGEGSVSIKKQHCNRKKGWSPNHIIFIQVGNSVVEPLNQMREAFKGSVFSFRISSGSKHWKWVITSRPALNFLRAIHPYVIIKKEQIRLVLEFEKECMRKEYPHRVFTPIKLIEKRDKYREELMAMNRSRVAKA